MTYHKMTSVQNDLSQNDLSKQHTTRGHSYAIRLSKK
jgi:hypothetical protein